MAVVKRLVRTDAAGYYIEYTHDDGHIETQPPGRPQTKEDIQRKQRQQLSLTKALKTAQADRTHADFIVNDPTSSNSRARAVFNQVVSAEATAEFSRSVDAVGVIAQTASVRPEHSIDVIKDVTLGGAAANERTEFSAVQPETAFERGMMFASVPHVPVSATREISND